MGTLGDLRTAVRAMTGDLNTVLFLDADMNRYINYALQALSTKTRSLQNVITSSSATLSQGDLYGGIQLPVDFLSELDVYWGNPYVRLRRMPYASYVTEALQAAAAQPTMYMIGDAIAGRRVLSPYPWLPVGLTGQQYNVKYVSRHATLVSDGETTTFDPLLDEAIVFYAASRCKMQEDDWSAAANLEARYQAEVKHWYSEQNNDHGELDNYTVRDEISPIYSIWEN